LHEEREMCECMKREECVIRWRERNVWVHEERGMCECMLYLYRPYGRHKMKSLLWILQFL